MNTSFNLTLTLSSFCPHLPKHACPFVLLLSLSLIPLLSSCLQNAMLCPKILFESWANLSKAFQISWRKHFKLDKSTSTLQGVLLVWETRFFPCFFLEGEMHAYLILADVPSAVAMTANCLHCIIDLVMWSVCHHRLHVAFSTHEKWGIMAQFLLSAEF